MDLPEWSSWSFRDAYLPESFHTESGFEAAKQRLHSEPVDGAMEVAIVLGISLALRDIMRQMEIDPDEIPAGVPDWIVASDRGQHDSSIAQCLSHAFQKQRFRRGRGGGPGWLTLKRGMVLTSLPEVESERFQVPLSGSIGPKVDSRE
jgi:hypothetical protein